MTAGELHTGSSPALAVAVVGGGLIGLSVAFRLAEAGRHVEIFDQATAGSEASWAGAGMLAPGGEIDSDSPLATLASTSRKLYAAFVRQLERESGLSIDLQEAGALELSYSVEEWDALNRKAVVQESLGINSRPLSPAQVTTFWPRVQGESLVGARFYPNDAIVNPRELVSALRVALRARGVGLQENSRVESIHVAPGSVHLATAMGGRTFAAAVVAMGAWSSSIAVTGVPPLPLAEPVKGHLLGYRQPEQTCGTIVRLGHTYLLQRANGLLIVGASVERIGFDRSIQPGVVADLERQASLVFPHLAETTPTEIWVGFRPGAKALHIGPWHSPRLQLAYGHYRNGILLAPITAQKVAAHLNASWEML